MSKAKHDPRIDPVAWALGERYNRDPVRDDILREHLLASRHGAMSVHGDPARSQREELAAYDEHQRVHRGARSGERSIPAPESLEAWRVAIEHLRDSREPSPVSDQLEMAYALAEQCSPGHELLMHPAVPDLPLKAELKSKAEHARFGAAWWKPARHKSDVALQIESPLQTPATLVGFIGQSTCRHVPVLTRDGLVEAARTLYAATRASLPCSTSGTSCAFCERFRFPAGEASILLRGWGFWIFADQVCGRCATKLRDSADKCGCKLTLISATAHTGRHSG